MVLGVFCAVVLAVTIAGLVALSGRPFSSIDENAHTSYALDVAHGRLPTMTTDVTRLLPGMFREPTYVANHPPLYYAFAGLVLRAGISAGHPEGGFFAARLLSAAFLAVALLAMAWSVSLLFPGRRRLAAIVPAVVGVTPLISSVSGIIWNDTAALATTSLGLACSINVVCRRLTRGRFGLLAAAATAAALTRSSGLTVVAIAMLACGFAAWRVAPVTRRRWVNATLFAFGLLAVVFVASGWFYLRNDRLYGDPTGSNVALAMFPAPHIPIVDSLSSATFWTRQYDQLFGRWQLLHGGVVVVARAIRWMVGLGLVMAALSWVRARYRRRPPVRTASRFGLGLLALQALFTVGMFFDYAHQGGATFARYLLPAALIAGLVVAVAVDHLPGARRGLPAAVLIASLTWIGLQQLSLGLAWHNPSMAHEETLNRFVTALAANGMPAPRLLVGLAIAVLVVAFALLVTCLWKLDGQPAPPVAASASAAIILPRAPVGSRHKARGSHRAGAPASPGSTDLPSELRPIQLQDQY